MGNFYQVINDKFKYVVIGLQCCSNCIIVFIVLKVKLVYDWDLNFVDDIFFVGDSFYLNIL